MSVLQPTEGAESTDERLELQGWYAELEANWDAQAHGSTEALREEEQQIIAVINQMEARLAAVPAQPAVTEAEVKQGAAETRMEATAVLSEQRQQPDVVSLTADLAKRLGAAQTEDALQQQFFVSHPDAILAWATGIAGQVAFDVTGKLDRVWDRNIQMWMHALQAAKRRLPPLADAGVITHKQAGHGIRACNEAREILQAILTDNQTADEYQGRSLGKRQKLSVMTGDGNKRLRPISNDAAHGSYGRIGGQPEEYVA